MYDLNRTYNSLKADIQLRLLEHTNRIEKVCADSNIRVMDGLNNITPHIDGFKLEAASNLTKIQDFIFRNYQQAPIIVPSGADNFLSGFFFCVKLVLVLIILFGLLRSFSALKTFISSVLGGGLLSTFKLWSLTSVFSCIKSFFGFGGRGPRGEGGVSSSESFSSGASSTIVVPQSLDVFSTTRNGSFETTTSINSSDYRVSTSSVVIIVPGAPRTNIPVSLDPTRIPKDFLLLDSSSVGSSSSPTDSFSWDDV